MKHYLLDTNAIITLLNQPDSLLVKKARKHDLKNIYLSSIVIYELFYGAYKSQKVHTNLNIVEALPFQILDFDKDDARTLGEIRAQLAHCGKIIGPYDILIADQAKTKSLILVTNNTREFSRIDGLKLEDWLKK